MKTFFLVGITFLFFITSCKKVEENPTYTLTLMPKQAFYGSETKSIRDTIFYKVNGTTKEVYRLGIFLYDKYMKISEKIKIIALYLEF